MIKVLSHPRPQLATFATLATLVCTAVATPGSSDTIALVVHGGAGSMQKGDLSAEREAEYRSKLKEGLLEGYSILEGGGSSLDAVEAVIRIYEDSPLFNAGKGAVFTAAGRNELDASIMDGSSLQAGAVASVTTIRNPISAARAVMEETRHVMLVGEGAETFAASQGLDIVEPSYFFTQPRWDSLQRAKERDKTTAQEGQANRDLQPDLVFGTVGALALDTHGNLAAATSTGGLTNKRFGRVGDSPIIGAGTYANKHCAVSATGEGEYFIRFTVARDICFRAEYGDTTVAEAADEVIHRVLPPKEGGTGGVITLDSSGKVAMPFNTAGMYRGYVLADGKPVIAIYSD